MRETCPVKCHVISKDITQNKRSRNVKETVERHLILINHFMMSIEKFKRKLQHKEWQCGDENEKPC